MPKERQPKRLRIEDLRLSEHETDDSSPGASHTSSDITDAGSLDKSAQDDPGSDGTSTSSGQPVRAVLPPPAEQSPEVSGCDGTSPRSGQAVRAVLPPLMEEIMETESAAEPKAKSRQPPRGQGKKRRNIRSVRDSLDSRNSLDNVALYDSILNDRRDVKEIVSSWLDKYKKDKDNALLSLQQLFISSSGCTGVLTPEMRELESAELIGEMAPKFDPLTSEYPLIMRGLKWKSFRERLGEFVEILIEQCQNSILYDQELLPDTKEFLISLTDSQIRAFRHTSTFAAMKLATALVRVEFTVSRNLSKAKRQLDAERQKSRAVDRIERLEARIEELEENNTELTENLASLYSAVFVQRYIDVSSDIRVICIHEISNWMKIFPEMYVNDKYLKYVGWNLSDMSSDVRIACLHALQRLYTVPELKPKLEGFTSMFKGRIVAMVLDVDPEAAAEAIRLVTMILANYREFLKDEDCERVFGLVYSPHSGVATAAGEFLRERLFHLDENESAVTLRSARGKPRPRNTPLIRDLVIFFIESELLEHAAYLVDALVDTNPMIKDWECMIDLLLEDAGPGEETLSNEAETCLIDIMACSVKQAATGETPVGRTPARKIQSKTEQRQIKIDRKILTEHFIPALPSLLEKYRADPEKLANLLIIPQYFNLSAYSSLHEERSLESLLRTIAMIVGSTLDTAVLEVAAKTLELFCIRSSPIAVRCEVSRSLIIESLVHGYRRAIITYRVRIARSETPDDEEIFAVIQSLKKIAIFYATHDLHSWNLRESLFRDIESAKDPSIDFPAEAVVHCISACRFYLMWSQHRLTNQDSDSRAELKLNVNRLRCNLDVFVESMKFFVDGRQNDGPSTTPMAIREEAYGTICDLLVFFSAKLAEDPNSPLRPLVYHVDEPLQHVLNRFVQERVFREEDDSEELDEDQRIEDLHKRRNLLAGYCKLVVYNIIPTKWAVDVFKHYVRFYNDHGDVIKATIVKARDINTTNCALTMLLSLKTLFLEIVADSRKMQRESAELRAIRELARKFAVLLPSAQTPENSSAVVAFHTAGITFGTDGSDSVDSSLAAPSANLPFFEILDEFSKKLQKQDRRVVFDYLNSRIPNLAHSPPGREWEPLLNYRKNLLQGIANAETARRRSEDQPAEDNAGNANGEQSDRDINSERTKRVARKTPLKVKKVTFTRGPRTSVPENDDQSSTPESPAPMIQDSPENPLRNESDVEETPPIETQIGVSQQIAGQRTSGRRTRSPKLFADE